MSDFAVKKTEPFFGIQADGAIALCISLGGLVANLAAALMGVVIV